MKISEEEIKILRQFSEKIDPKDPSSHNNLAIVFFNRGLLEDAIQELKKALEINPDFKIAQRNLIIILKRTGKIEDYIEKPLREVAQNPQNIEARLKLAESYYHIGKFMESAIEYKNVLTNDPGNLKALKGLGIAKKKMGLLQEALATFKKANKLHPGDEEILRNMGELYYNMGLYEMAVKYLKDAIKINPDSAESHLLLSFALGEIGLIEDALDEAIKAKELNPYLAEVTNIIGLEDEKVSAEEELREAMGIKAKIKIDTFQSRFELAQVYKNKFLLNDAIRELQRALEEKPESREALKLKAEIEILQGNYDESVLTLERINPKDFHTWNMTACVFLLKGFKEKAKKIWEGIKNYPYALNNYALLLILENREEAEQMLKRAYESEEGFMIPLYNLFFLKFIEGKKEESEEILGEIVDLFPTDPIIVYNYARTLFEKGNIQEAEKAIKNALEFFPENYLLLNFLKKIYTEKGEEDKIPEIKAIETKKVEKGEVFLLAIAGSPRGIPYIPPELTKREKLKDFKIMLHKARQAVSEENYEDAEKILQELRKSFPEDFEVNYLLGEMYYKMGFYEAAENVFINLKKSTRDSRIIFRLAEIYTNTGRLDEAEKEIKHIEHNVNFRNDVLLLLSEIKEKKGDYSNALKIMGELLDYKKEDIKALLRFGVLLTRMARFEDAKKTFSRILDRNPQNTMARYYLAKAYLYTKEVQKSKEISEELYKENAQNPYAHLLKGEILIKERKYEEAFTHLQNAININFWLSMAHYYIGILYALRGEHTKAISHWEKVVKIEPYTKIGKKAGEYIKTTLHFLNLLKKEME